MNNHDIDITSALREMSKSAGVLGAIGKGLWGTLKFGGRAVKRTAMVGKGVPLGVAAVGGASYGAYRLAKGPGHQKKYDYDTHLRNNVLAGRINAGELSNPEMKSVRNLGMK